MKIKLVSIIISLIIISFLLWLGLSKWVSRPGKTEHAKNVPPSHTNKSNRTKESSDNKKSTGLYKGLWPKETTPVDSTNFPRLAFQLRNKE